MNFIHPTGNWKSVPKGRRSRKTKPRSFKVSDSDKLWETAIPVKSEHIPIKKRRHLLQSGDFSGIELLAAAASMNGDADHSTKENFSDEDFVVPKRCDASILAMPSKLVFNASQSPRGSMKDGTTKKCVLAKEDRRHWDLNTLMDAWNEPYEDSIATSNSKGAIDFDMQVDGKKGESEDHALLNPGGMGVYSCTFKREDKLKGVALNRTCTELSGLEKLSLKPPNASYSSALGETSDQAIDGKNSNEFLTCDVDLGISNQVMKADSIIESKNTISNGIAVMQNEDFSSNLSGSDITKDTVRVQNTQDVTLHYVPTTEISASMIAVKNKDSKNSPESSELHGNLMSLRDTPNSVACKRVYVYNPKSSSDEASCFSSSSNSGNFRSAGTVAEDGQCVAPANSKIRNIGTSITDSVADCRGPLEMEKLIVEHEDTDLPNDGSHVIKLEDSCNSYSARAQFGDSTLSPGQVDSTIDARPDSPYEDGELRGSFLYDWEENEMENECIDYEFSGRNGVGSDAADYFGSEIVEGISEGSHGTERRKSMMKRSGEVNVGKNGSVTHCLRRNFLEDGSKNDKIGSKKASNGGFGTTVEQFMEVLVEETDSMKKRPFAYRKDTINGKPLMGGYSSRTAWGKLGSHTEGRSSLDTINGRGASFECRSSRFSGSYSREKDNSPEKYVDSYRPATHRSERDGIAQWPNWGSRGRSSTYRGTGGRNYTRPRTGVSPDKFNGLDFHDQRQNGTPNYSSKGFRKPFERMRSPVDRDHSFDARGRMQQTRGIVRSRSSGNFLQSPSRDFVDNFEPMPNDAAAISLSRYVSRGERSFSPSSGRGVPLTQRRSRSRSRTRLPTSGNSYKERNFVYRRQSRSPDFRSETRTERMRVPFLKPNFAPDYNAGYISSPKGRFSPQRNFRWDDERKFENNNFKNRRSPTGVIRPARRFDAVNPSGRVNSDNHVRSTIRPRRFPFTGSNVRDSKFENNYEDRKWEDQDKMMLRRRQPDDGGNFRQFRQGAGDDMEMRKSINENGTRDTEPKDIPLALSNTEDKRVFITLT